MRSDSIDIGLQKSEILYRMLFDYSMDGIILTDPRDGGTILSANPAACRMLGWTAEELIGKERDAVLDLQDQALPAFLDEREHSGSARASLTYRRKDGTTFFGEVSSAFFIDNTGEPRTVSIIRDITERLQLEEQIRQRAEELEMVMEVTPVAIWIGHDPQSHNITGNQMANEFYEAEVGENVSANVTNVRHFFRKGRELTADELPMQEASQKDIDIRDVEFDVLLPSGEWRALLGSASPLHDAEGHVRGSVGTFIDITQRKQAEEELLKAYIQVQEQSEELQVQNEELQAQSEELQVQSEELQAQSEELQTKNEELQIQSQELQEAYEALLESEKQYSALFNARTNGISHCRVVVNEEGKPIDYIFLQVNNAYAAITQKTKMDIEGKTATEVFPGIEHLTYDYIGNYGKIALEDGEDNIEVFFEPLQRWLSIYVYSPRYGDFTTILIDITRRKQAEKALRESEAKIRVIFSALSEGVIFFNAQGDVEEANDVILRTYGHTLKELTDPDHDKSSQIIRPDGTPFPADEQPAIVVLRTGEAVYNVEMGIPTSDGKLCWNLVNAQPAYDNKGKLLGAVVSFFNITARKEAEAKLKETLDNLENLVKDRTAELKMAYESLKESEKGLAEAQEMVHLGNWKWNILTDRTYLSDEAYRIFGLKPQERDVNYSDFLSYEHPDDRAYVENAVKESLSGKPLVIDYRIVLADGRERTVHTQGKVIFDEKRLPSE